MQTTQSVNLIPHDRRRQRLVRRAMHRWSAVASAYVLMVLLSWVIYSSTGAREYRALAGEVALAESHDVKAKDSLDHLRRQLAEVAQRRTVAEEIRNRPDWSLLMRTLSDSVGDEVVLREISLTSATPVGPDGRPKDVQLIARDEYVLNLKGVGASQQAASQFILRLQRTGLFGTIKTLRSGRETFGALTGVGFEIQCPLPEGMSVN